MISSIFFLMALLLMLMVLRHWLLLFRSSLIIAEHTWSCGPLVTFTSSKQQFAAELRESSMTTSLLSSVTHLLVLCLCRP